MDAAPTVRLNDDEVRGTWSDGIARFRGIPYATAERFAPPVPVTTWGRSRRDRVRSDRPPGRRARSSSGPTSSRTSSASRSTCGRRPPTTRGRPIMVWIHGGAFRTGSGASPLYEGTTLAARGDVVVITINYRLGLLGFLGHPDLAADAGGPCANWGLLDCVEALRWVQAHGAAFGGDPDDVTIFGESAGAAAVALLCAMPMARGLFHKAVVQSGAPLTSRMERAVELAERATELAGVSSVDELRDAARRADPRRAAAGGGRRRRPHVHPGGRRNGGPDPAGPCAPRRVRGRDPAC